jgi:hypothetical protein
MYGHARTILREVSQAGNAPAAPAGEVTGSGASQVMMEV